MSITSEITRLQTAKADIKTAIEGKGVTVPSSTTLDEYDELIESIPSGCMQDSWIGSLKNRFMYTRFPTNTELELTLTYYDNNSLDFSSAFNNCYNLKKLTINADFMPTTIGYAFANSNATNLVIEEICLNFSTHNVTRMDAAFTGIGHWNTSAVPCKITGTPLDLTSCTNVGNMFTSCNKLTDVRFAQNTIMVSFNVNGCINFIDDCFVSIANGLNGTVTGKTLTLQATQKAKISTIMGTVTDGIFTADASGTVTLQDFITNTKGWTIA